MLLDCLHIFTGKAGIPAYSGEEGAELDAALGFGGSLQDVADFRFGAPAVPGCAHAQRPMGLLRQVPYRQSGHRGTLFMLQAVLSSISL